MIECFPQLHNDPDTRCVIINGAGQAFTAGMTWLLWFITIPYCLYKCKNS